MKVGSLLPKLSTEKVAYCFWDTVYVFKLD